MEFYLPTFLVFLMAWVVVFTILPKFGPKLFGILAILLLGWGVYKHINTFKDEYRQMSWGAGAAAAAPYILVTGVILYIIGYVFLLGGGKKVRNISMNVPPMSSVPSAMVGVANSALRGIGMPPGPAPTPAAVPPSVPMNQIGRVTVNPSVTVNTAARAVESAVKRI